MAVTLEAAVIVERVRAVREGVLEIYALGKLCLTCSVAENGEYPVLSRALCNAALARMFAVELIQGFQGFQG